jgi:putative hydrolase of the HAD superfamily
VNPEGSGEPRRGVPVDPEGSGEPRRGAPVDPQPQRRWLLLDFGGVISRRPTGADWAALRGAAGWSDGQGFAAAYWADRHAYDLGELTPGQYWGRVAAGHGVPDPGLVRRLADLDARMWLRPDTRVLERIGAARQGGIGVAILSNMPHPIARTIDAQPWAAPFDPRLYSCDLGTGKPAASAFQAALDRLEAAPDRVVFVDDLADNVAGARRVGIPSLDYDGPATIDRALGLLARRG